MIDRAPQSFPRASSCTASALPFALLFILACGPGLPPHWNKPCGGRVTAALSSVTLADDCSAQAGAAAPESDFTDCASRQSSMQLQFASSAKANAKIEIRAVRLIDPATGKIIENLRHRDAQQWSLDRYLGWDETLRGGTTVKATYKLSAPGSSGARMTGFGIASKHLVEVDVAVDGELRTLSIEASREPDVVT